MDNIKCGEEEGENGIMRQDKKHNINMSQKGEFCSETKSAKSERSESKVNKMDPKRMK